MDRDAVLKVVEKMRAAASKHGEQYRDVDSYRVLQWADDLDALAAADGGRGEVASDDELRALWRKAGGGFHGPHIETGTMPEATLLPFLRSLQAPAPSAGVEGAIVPGMGSYLENVIALLWNGLERGEFLPITQAYSQLQYLHQQAVRYSDDKWKLIPLITERRTAAIIASELARMDGYDPEDLQGGLYDLRWSGGPSPEPEGDAWNMDYLPKGERIAKALTAPPSTEGQRS